MKERGIIFQGWGVRAIRNLQPDVWPPKAIDPALPIKWQTRRTRGLDEVNKRPDDWRFEGWSSLKEGVALFGDMAASEPTQIEIKCPYGIEGDGLYVRESFWHQQVMVEPHYPGSYACGEFVENAPWMEYVSPWMFEEQEAGAQYVSDDDALGQTITDHIRYKATDKDPRQDGGDRATWIGRPSIHMYRWASREDLLVKEVRVERVQDITEPDAIAEGLMPVEPDDVPGGPLCTGYSVQLEFRNIWDEINGAGAWERNDYLWVGSYMRKGK